MAKIGEWSGNEYSEMLLPSDTNKKLTDFCNGHKSIYIFGAGKIGNGMKHYLEQSGYEITGFVTSDSFENFKKIYKQGETGIVIGISDKYFEEVMPLIKSLVYSDDLFLSESHYRENIGSRFSVDHVKENLMLSFLLVSHCNLNCKSCRAFSPICRPDFYKYSEFEKDIEQLKKLNLPLKALQFSGGEPLLHPNLFDVFKKARELFPDIVLRCLTNGTLLDRLNDEQMETLVELDVVMSITKYPIGNKAVESFCLNADKIGAKYNIVDYGESKVFIVDKLVLSGDAPKYDFYNCFCNHAKACLLLLLLGRIYNCTAALHIPYFNERFNTDFKISDRDYIDIYNTTPEEIYQFKIMRKPFCGYHNSANRSLIEWGISERKIEEWVHFE